MYKELSDIQRLLWKNDDYMDQETLFELQEKMAELVLNIAIKEHKIIELLAEFPWLYETEAVNKK